MSESKQFDEVVQPTVDVSKVASKETVSALEELKTDTEKQFLEHFKELASQDEYQLNGRTWKRRKLSYKENKEIERLSREAIRLKVKSPDEFEELQEKVYKKLANYCLVDAATNKAMTPIEFENSEAELITKILDAINYRTQSGLPSFQKA
jgi:hypothetical protein